MRVEDDVSSVRDLTDRARKELAPAGVLRAMRPPLVLAAAGERATHLYRNRTGNLQDSTAAETVEATRERVSVSLQMTMHYAEFVWRRGLSAIDSYGAAADQEIKRRFAEQADRIRG